MKPKIQILNCGYAAGCSAPTGKACRGGESVTLRCGVRASAIARVLDQQGRFERQREYCPTHIVELLKSDKYDFDDKRGRVSEAASAASRRSGAPAERSRG